MMEDSTLMKSMESQIMMNQTSSARKRPSKNEKLLLDDFIHFLHSRQSLHLTMNQLNQIIRIHGFKKIHHAPKKVLMHAVDSLDLMELQRSTLHQNVSAWAVLTVDEVIADLADLNWQECCVTSVEKFSSNDNNNFFFSDQHSLQLANQPQPQPLSHSYSEKLFSPKRIRKFDEVYGSGLIPEASRSSVPAAKMVPRRNGSSVKAPTATYPAAASTTVDSASLASC